MIIGWFWRFGTEPRMVLSASDKLIAAVIFSVLFALMGYVMLRQSRKA